MEVVYEHFYELQGYSLIIGMTVYFFRPYLLHRLNRRRNVIRLYNQSPLWLRIKAKVNDTKIGKLNLKTHLIWEKFRNDYADKFMFYSYTKLNLWYFKTSLIYLLGGALAAFLFAEAHEGFRCEAPILTRANAFITHSDKSSLYLRSVKDPQYANDILDWDLKNKLHSDTFQVLDCIQYGKLMSSVLQDEIAYQCYYLAHLKDHQNIGANSEFNSQTQTPSV